MARQTYAFLFWINPKLTASLTAAKQLNNDVHCIIIGQEKCSEVAAELQKFNTNIKKIFVAENAIFKGLLSEVVTPFLLNLQKQNNYTHILGGASTYAKSILPRLAALLDVQPITDVTKIIDSEKFTRNIYAGNAILTLKSNDKIKVMTIRGTAFEAAKPDNNNGAQIEQLSSFNDIKNDQSEFVSQQLQKSERPELTAARIVISGGRALKSKENFKLLFDLADVFPGQAAVGASRAAVDAGYCPNDMQIGQTGKIVAPELYLAIGISGAIQHVAGMKDSKIIVAINKDGDCPIYQIADYSLVGDLFKIVPELTEQLKKK
ncbi:unnamed protein product [Didymodactylos carnosus]|uniref:Electron transfer flavoprotein subunit alpha n=2 Tax=Didymodactylos carnosus TaxID=1234261 RepID=A0A814P3Y1_9BILA|nr:unnamed protein product [Didymodactylos carnosus]CAF3865254.1 unnamed protein product [Didymodactylos carnosus]